ncbi:hypothetical protein DICVIV_03101 [Dictyocaulus viviparus]|uniref:Uncharacterized protein n=1 Tax=Dictyocaulus viviparus TaxID=29172 RepID=A0A0D8Y441_DICVI|nr:hypothetical protein DICVIV_03101 [Dictyocaulus viviparus]
MTWMVRVTTDKVTRYTCIRALDVQNTNVIIMHLNLSIQKQKRERKFYYQLVITVRESLDPMLLHEMIR